jgi:hypothetical protein
MDEDVWLVELQESPNAADFLVVVEDVFEFHRALLSLRLHCQQN